MFGINYKNWIKESADQKIAEYIKWLNVSPSWDNIQIGYASADHERFMELYQNHICKHPKRLYRPGKTVICHFTPISNDIVKKYHDGKIAKEEWEKLCANTWQISRGITDGIIATLRSLGREVALLTEQEGWSHACGGEIAGMGKFEYKDEMFHKGNQIGYMGSAITEVEIK
ncbi:MAG: hypothetical protein ACOX5F_03305 [Anaerovoracaceae bacterium]|jgi:hypothetical protein